MQGKIANMNNSINKKLSIPNKYLILIAGIVWIFAGLMVIKTGFPYFVIKGKFTFKILLAASVFLVFYVSIFSRLVDKHTNRINSDSRTRMFFLEFFDKKSYLIMLIMILGGITIRKLSLLPGYFIGFFYVGIGLALFSCGVKFVYNFMTLPI
jgi:hypothetical protein